LSLSVDRLPQRLEARGMGTEDQPEHEWRALPMEVGLAY
jgi:hypothetical protein